MSTRAQVRFATREDGVTFSEHPDKINAQFYVHHDGYPEGLGLDIANSIASQHAVMHWEIEHVQDIHTDLDYIYYIWSKYDDDTWISIFKVNILDSYCNECGHALDPQLSFKETSDECVFVGTPEKLIEKYGGLSSRNGHNLGDKGN
jgi:hypothetical protein